MITIMPYHTVIIYDYNYVFDCRNKVATYKKFKKMKKHWDAVTPEMTEEATTSNIALA